MSDLQRYFQEKWDNEGAQERWLNSHDRLNSESIVFDVGGYCGDWADHIAYKYDPHIYIFEPVQEFFAALRDRFADNPKVKVEPYGLGSRDGFFNLYKCGAGSSLYRTSNSQERCEFKEFPRAVFELLQVQSMADVKIDLVSMNIEGGEYDLLMSMSNSGLMYQCRDIQIQFHPLWGNSYDERNRLRNLLIQTHDEVYCYPFVWEMWRRR